MKLGNKSFAAPKCWPEYDIYFKAGISALHEKLNAYGIHRQYSFMHLNGYTLKDFLSYLLTDSDDHVVIISSPRLLPIANFWMANHRQVLAVMDSKINIETIVTMLKLSPSHKGGKCYTDIAPKEIIMLRHYLFSGNMDYIQRRYCRSYTTIQQWKSKLAHKLLVRKLEHLTLTY